MQSQPVPGVLPKEGGWGAQRGEEPTQILAGEQRRDGGLDTSAAVCTAVCRCARPEYVIGDCLELGPRGLPAVGLVHNARSMSNDRVLYSFRP